MHTPHRNQILKAGFTLIEMSIIVLIIALLIAGIVLSSDLVRSSKLLQIIVQVDEYNKAMGVFQQKYKELPGDLSNAQNFWGTEGACPTTSTDTAHKETCNGNGDGTIGNPFVDAGASNNETFRAWQHLSNAGLITGAYSGTEGAGGTLHAKPGINVPAGFLKGTGFTLQYIFLPSGNADYWAMIYGHSYIYGLKTTSSITNGAALTPKEAYQIDTKSDDGKPAFGRIVTNKSNTLANCTTSDTATASTYKFTNENEGCNLIFITGW